jgi:hypothetical protein
MNKKETYAEDMPYWKTSQAGPDAWLDKVKAEIQRAGGKVLSSMYGDDDLGRAAFMIRFRFGEDEFKLIWPVLQSKTSNLKAAKIQAVTMLYHAVKARAVEVRVRGARAAFYGDWLLSDGRTAAEASQEQFLANLPGLLPAPRGE